jgi:hypothetical protein
MAFLQRCSSFSGVTEFMVIGFPTLQTWQMQAAWALASSNHDLRLAATATLNELLA